MRQIDFLDDQLSSNCNIVAVGKRRDGGIRYWCLEHKADATAKYGLRGDKCRYSDIPPILEDESLIVNLELYPGGVALWGAVPPIYDTTRKKMDRGIHVHARKRPGGGKVIDGTFRKVTLLAGERKTELNELDAIYFMVSSIFGFDVKNIHCTRCGHPHLDRDWFSVHPHKSHLCAGCGRNFRDKEKAIGNPIGKLVEWDLTQARTLKLSQKLIRIKQANYPFGIQLWGSNPAFFWTAPNNQESGIHLHAFSENSDVPTLDDTYKEIEIDGIKLNEEHVRTYMAQNSLPHISNRVRSVVCTECQSDFFDNGENAYSPRIQRSCNKCGKEIKVEGRLKKVIANPMSKTILELSKHSVLEPQTHDLGLLPETI